MKLVQYLRGEKESYKWRLKKHSSLAKATKVVIPALIGFFIASLLSPLIGPAIAKFYVSIDLAEKPSLTIKAFYSPTSQSYQEGSKLKDFENLTWKNDYGIYWFMTQNTGDVDIWNFKIDLNFLGAVVASNTVPEGGADFSILNTGSAQIIENGEETDNIRYCSKMICANHLMKDQAIIVGFVIDHKIRENVAYFDFNPSNEFTGKYSWYYCGAKFEERIEGCIVGNENITKAVWVNYGIWIRNSSDLFQESIEYFNRSLDIDPNYVPALFQRGISRGMIGGVGENETNLEYLLKSLEDFERVIMIDENNKKAWYNKGVVELKISDYYLENKEKSELYYWRCVTSLENALSIDPDYTQAKNMLDTLR